jgi:predicted dehydrogenase
MNHYSCVIVGLGAIGMGYDYYSDNLILTHANAIKLHPCFDLVSAVDLSPKRRELFESKFNIKAYQSIEEIPRVLKIDIFVVCTPTQFHLSSISKIVNNFSPLAILCEKPMSNNFAEADLFFSNHEISSRTEIFVNYIRRADQSSQIISQIIQDEDTTFRIKGHCYYTKGAINNASHFLNLMESWFGQATLKPLSSHYPCEVEGDFNLDFMATFDKASIIFQSGIESVYSLYQFQLYLSSGILSYANGGADIFFLSREFISKNPTPYRKPWRRISSHLDKYQYHVYDELLKALNGQSSMLPTKVEALHTLKSLSNLKKQSS